MRYFNIKIKGSNIWKACALIALAVFLICCEFRIYNIQQPATANAGETININTRDSAYTNIQSPPEVANFIAGILLPKGFDGTHNMKVTYTSTIGDGNMQPISPSIIEPSTSNSTHLNYAASFMNKFGIGNNLINDMEWVVFIGTQTANIPNGTFEGNINFQLKVGADGNTTIFKTAFVICESVDGLNLGGTPPLPDYGFNNGPRMVVNGPGDLNDLCDPQITTIVPAKSLQNDFVTLTYNSSLDTLKLLKGNNLYLCVDTAYTSDGSKLTGFCSQTGKTQLTQTSSSSGVFAITFWPASFLGLTSSQTVTKMAYHIIDANGNKVGLGDTTAPFVYKYACN
jgi:hypothetical protein